jgi:hypothetical protein
MDEATNDFDQHFAGLLDAAGEASVLLRRYGEERWASWLDGDAERVRRGDRYGLDHLLTAFGGMGSLNDLMFHRLNGHDITDEEAETANEQLSGHVGRIFRHASHLQRELRQR